MKKIKLFEEFANEALNPNEFEKAVKDLAYSMPNHTGYEDVPTEDQIMTAMKKYQKDLYKHSTSAQKKEAVEKVLQILSESLSEAIDLSEIEVGTELYFKDGESWKVTKIVGRASNPRAFLAKPHNEKAKKANTSIEIEMKPDFLKKELTFYSTDVEENASLDEATTSWAKMMKGVKRSETGPWTLVAIQDRKVVAQDIDIKDRNLLPASFETMRKEWPKAKIHIEDGTGMVVWNESVNEGFFGPFVFNDKTDTEKLKEIYNDAVDGYANWQRGFEYPKADYKKAYQEAEKILKKRGVKVDESFNEAKVEDMTPEEVASKWKKGTKIKWSSPNGVLDDMVMGHDGIYIKIKSGGTIPYQSIVESRSTDVMYAIKDIREYNKTKKTPGDFNKMVTSIIKNLGFDDTDDNFERIADHLGNSADEDDNIPEDKDLVNELFGLLESVSVNEAKTMDRDDMMTYLEDKYGFRARTTEEFDNSSGGIWVSGEDGQSIGGKRIYSYYSEGKAYEFGVLVRYEKAINKLGWYSEWYDAGTVMIWPL